MQTKKYRVHGFIKLTSPLNIASPAAARYNSHEENRTTYGNAGIPCTTVQKMLLPQLRRKAESDHGASDVREWQADCPVIPANNLNGHLRRAAAAIIFDALHEKGEKVKMETYSAMTCGAVTGKPDSGLVKFDEYQEARKHVYLGLMGGGPRMMRRYVRVHNAFPVTEETLASGLHSGVSRHPAFDGAEAYEKTITVPPKVRMVQTWTFIRGDELRALTDIQTQALVIDDYLVKIQARQAQILADQKSKAEGEEGSRFSTRTFTAMEFIVPGISFPVTFELDVTEAQLGLFLLALDRFATQDRLGGWSRNGFGQFVMQKVVLVDAQAGQEADKELFQNGKLDRSEDGTAYPYLQAFFAAANEMSAERLDYLMRPPVEDDGSKKGKKGAKQQAAPVTASSGE